MHTITVPRHPVMADDHLRYQLRCALEKAGCESHGYHEDGFTVAIKRDCLSAVLAAAEQHGLELRDQEGDFYNFPLGSDNPPEEFRHHCPRYPNAQRPGFWLFARLRFKPQPSP